jgi:hypothetical protein
MPAGFLIGFSSAIPSWCMLDLLQLHFFFLAFFAFSGKTFKASFAFIAVTTFLPVLASNSSLATFATVPPCIATFLLSSKFFGLVAAEISFVEASASMFKISSVLVILSRRFSFLKPFNTLYSLVV